jgi:hypothetical protein
MGDGHGRPNEDPHEDGASDSDEEEDEDYVPDADPDRDYDDNGEDDDGDDGAAAIRGAHPALSAARRKAVDDAFRDLFGYRYRDPIGIGGAPPHENENEVDDDDRPPSPPPSPKRRRTTAILSSIFGGRAGAEIARRAKRAASHAGPKPPSAGGMVRLERRIVVEVRRFAGQEIRVERAVTVPVMSGGEGDDGRGRGGGDGDGVVAPVGGSKMMPTSAVAADADPAASDSAAASGKAGGGGGRGRRGGVDDLLAEMSRPEKLSVASKTSADWDLFKAKNADTALGDQLESKARGNDAFLVKRDFLTRVDHRRFELERADRDRERAKRGK